MNTNIRTISARLLMGGMLSMALLTSAGAHPFEGTDEEVRDALVLSFDEVPVGQQIAMQGNRAVAQIRTSVRIERAPLPAPLLDMLARLDGDRSL